MKCILIIVVSYFLCTFFFKSILFCASWYRLHDQQIFCILFRHFIFYFLQFFFFPCIVHFVDLIVKRLSSWRARLPTRDHFSFFVFYQQHLEVSFFMVFQSNSKYNFFVRSLCYSQFKSEFLIRFWNLVP